MSYNFHENAYVDLEVPSTYANYVIMTTRQSNLNCIQNIILYKCSLKTWCRTYHDNINLKIPIICYTKITTTTLTEMLSMIMH